MNNTTKIAATLIVTFGLLISSAGIAAASPHVIDWGGARLTEEPAKATRLHNAANKSHHNSQIANLKSQLGTHYLRDGTTNTRTVRTIHVGDSLRIPDGDLCLKKMKETTLQETEIGLHDTVHCLHDGTRAGNDRTSKFFSAGLHNTGSFLPPHRSLFMTIR